MLNTYYVFLIKIFVSGIKKKKGKTKRTTVKKIKNKNVSLKRRNTKPDVDLNFWIFV